MQRPNWLSGWGEGKNILEARLLIDTLDITVVEASFKKKPFFFAIGAAHENDTGASSATITKEDIESRTDLKWEIFYDPTILPQSVPFDMAKNLMANLVSLCTGNASVYKEGTVYIPSGDKPTKGNAPVLHDYEIARKIQEAKRRRKGEHSVPSPQREQA